MRRLKDVTAHFNAAMPAPASTGPGPEPAEALRLRRAVKARGLRLDVARHANGKVTYTVRDAAGGLLCIVSAISADEVDAVELFLDRIADASPGAIDAARARLADAEADADRLLVRFDEAKPGAAQLAAFRVFDAAHKRRCLVGAELSMLETKRKEMMT